MNSGKLGKVKRSVTALLAGFLVVAGLVVSPQMQTIASAATIQGWCNSSTGYWVGSSYVFIPTYGGTRACQMSYGSYSSGVEAMQVALRSCHGYGIAADGDWGPATDSAVLQFQRARGLSADAVYGPQTHNALKWYDYAPVVNLGYCVYDYAL